jgi:hypothetical protein
LHAFPDLPWQRPNATEAAAAQQLLNTDPPLSSEYLAYPWATLIDCHSKGSLSSDVPSLRGGHGLSRGGVVATACQHIWALKYMEFFQRAGVTDLFWSHATPCLRAIGDIRIHPLPLYPVRCASHPPYSPCVLPWKRKFLYSFQGAYSPGLYLTEVRDWILNLPVLENALLVRRREWHFEQAVYREQVLKTSIDNERHAQLEVEANIYASTLQQSCFALCPSGSGPNSIRLWEALGYGSIPVILSDQLQVPGPLPLWHSAAIFIPETKEAVDALPRQLEALASDHRRLEAMQQSGQVLWRRYGLDKLATDVVEFLRNPMPVLRSRALESLPAEPIEILALRPGDLPVEVSRNLRNAPPDLPVLIHIPDQEMSGLLHIRWRIALELCKEILGERKWSLVCLSPSLENFALK